jgi:DNA-binding NarL/FixJ family response regulator
MRIKNNNMANSVEMDLLSALGNKKPTMTQIKLVKKMVNQIGINHQLLFDNRLLPQEKNCLFYAAHGYCTKGTAKLLQCEASTVKHYRQEVLRKLGCDNMAHAVFVGIKYGYLSINDENNDSSQLPNGREDPCKDLL